MKRPARGGDVNQRAARVVAAATTDSPTRKGSPHIESGRKGGQVRAARLTPERRREIAMMGVEARKKAAKGA